MKKRFPAPYCGIRPVPENIQKKSHKFNACAWVLFWGLWAGTVSHKFNTRAWVRFAGLSGNLGEDLGHADLTVKAPSHVNLTVSPLPSRRL